MKNYVILYNPLAGNCHGKETAETIPPRFPEDNFRFQDVTSISDYADYLETLPQDEYPLLTGGDGTLNHFVNGLDPDKLTREVYYYPAGTGNDFMNDIKDDVGDNIFCINKYLLKLPVATVNGKDYRVLNGVGYGIDGYCCEVGDQQKAKSDKPVNYTSIAIKGLLFHFKPRNAVITVDGVTKEYKKVWLAPTMNGRFYGGGMNAAPSQDRLNEERTISTLIFYGIGKLKALLIFPSIFKGEHVKHTECIQVIRGKEATVRFDVPCALQVDGETILNVSEYHMVSAEK